MIGDVIGSPGRKAVQRLLPSIRREYGLNLVVCNGENAAGGLGITYDTAQDLLRAGVDIFDYRQPHLAKEEIIPPSTGRPAHRPALQLSLPA